MLLVANAAQDIQPNIWDVRFDPMGASPNSPTLCMGTPWFPASLLNRDMKEARWQNRLFTVPWSRVAEDVPGYWERVKARIEQFGQYHPFIRTEYFCEELQAGAGFSTPSRLLIGQDRGGVGAWVGLVALLMDVAGADETSGSMSGSENLTSKRDSTAITVIGVDTGGDWPAFRVLTRLQWVNVPISQQTQRLKSIFKEWGARFLVVDSTGVGAGLASNLVAAPGEKKVLPFVFTQKSKSDLLWNWIGLIETGRYLEYQNDGAADTRLFWEQLNGIETEVLAGPERLVRWSVPDPGLHDDLVMSAALVSILEGQDWRERVAG